MDIRWSLSTVLVAVVAWPLLASAQSVVTRDEISRAIALQNVRIENNRVSGEVVNRSPHRMRDVEVLIQYHWLWKDEFDPGQNPPGKAVFLKVKEEIPSGMSAPFTYAPPSSLGTTKEGRFMHEVSVAAFTVVVTPQGLSSR